MTLLILLSLISSVWLFMIACCLRSIINAAPARQTIRH